MAPQARAPPGPDGLPVLGSTVSVMRDPFGFYEQLRRYGDVVRYRTLLGTFTTLFHPDHVERVLVSDQQQFEQVDIADFDVGIEPQGLVDVRGEQWRRQRTVLQPAFTLDRVQSHADAMVAATRSQFDTWVDGQLIRLDEAASRLTLDVLTRSLFDLDLDDDDAEVVADTASVLNEQLAVGNLTMLLPSWLPTPANRRFERTYAAFVDRVDALIDERRQRDHQGEDLLSILLRAEGDAGETLTDDEVRDNMLTFLFAGHETTALALTYTVLLLARHGTVADRLRTEVDEVVATAAPGIEHLPELALTERVLDEALRLYPPIPVLFRQPTEPVTFDGYRIGPESLVTLPVYSLHRDGRLWDDPTTFDPDRWRDEGTERPAYAYFPFGGGPRHCIGMRFARLELQLVLALFVQNFYFELRSDPEPELDPGMTLRPADPVEVRVRRR